MDFARTVRWSGRLGLCGLVVLGFGLLGGCNGGDHSGMPHGDHDTGDAHESHDHAREVATPAATPPAVAGSAAKELKSIQPSSTYALATCVVSGDSLTEMGGPIAFMYGDTEVQFCCKGCIKTFNKDPEAFMKKVRDAKK